MDAHKWHFVAISPHRKHREALYGHFPQCEAAAESRNRRTNAARRACTHVGAFEAIVQNPACYVTVSLRKLVTLNLSSNRPTVVKRIFGNASRYCARFGLDGMRACSRVYNVDVFETPLDFDSTTWLSLCTKRASSQNREIPARIYPSASVSSLKLEAAGGHKFLYLENIRHWRSQKKLELKN